MTSSRGRHTQQALRHRVPRQVLEEILAPPATWLWVREQDSTRRCAGQVYTNLYWTLPRDRLEGAPRAAAAPDLTTPSLTPFLGGAAPAASERAEAAAPLMEAGPLELASMERQAAGGNPPV